MPGAVYHAPMCEPRRQAAETGDSGAMVERPSADGQLWVQAHRAAAQAAVATALGVRVLHLELRDGPPPLGVVTLTKPGSDDFAPANTSPPDYGRVRLLAYTVVGPLAERVAEAGGVPLQGEPAYQLATSVLAQMRKPDDSNAATGQMTPDDRQTDQTQTDQAEIARLLLEHFGERMDDAAEAAEHLAMNVEAWVCQHWGSIALVAVHLLRHRQITGDGIRQLMPPTSAPPGLDA